MSAEEPTGVELAEELRAAAASAGVSIYAFVTPLATSNASSFLANLSTAQHPKPLTIARVRALCAGEPLPEARPSTFEKRFGLTRHAVPEPRDSGGQRTALIELGERAAARRLPGETLAASLKRLEQDGEVEESAETQAEAQARRDRELAELASPSALIRRAARDWPEQSAAVAAIAAEMGVAKGEAWRRVIVAGIDILGREG